MSEETKLSSLGEEVHRRLKNNSLDTELTKRMEILDSVYESEGSHKKPGQLAEDRTKIMKKKTWYEGKEMD